MAEFGTSRRSGVPAVVLVDARGEAAGGVVALVAEHQVAQRDADVDEVLAAVAIDEAIISDDEGEENVGVEDVAGDVLMDDPAPQDQAMGEEGPGAGDGP